MTNHKIEEYNDPDYPELEEREGEFPCVSQSYASDHKILGRCGGVFCDAEISVFAKTAGETFYVGEFGVGGTVLYCSENCAMSDVAARGFGWSDIQMALKCQRKGRS